MGPEVLEGERRPRWVFCRVKGVSQLRNVAGSRFKEVIVGRVFLKQWRERW